MIENLKVSHFSSISHLLEMTAVLNEKDAAFKVVQQELAVIKDFRVFFTRHIDN